MPEILLTHTPTPGARYATVTLHHPEKFNAMSRSMWRQLRQIFNSLQEQTKDADPLRCVLLQGANGHFCAGGDIAEYPGFRFDEASLREFHEQDVWGGLNAILQCDCPVIGAISGNCMGAGVELASCCDIRIATQDSRFGAPIAKLGFPMAPQEAALVSSKLGDTCTRSILLEAAIYDAKSLHQQGFLTRLVADSEQLQHEVEQSIQRILRLAPASARLNKQQLRQLQALASTDAVNTRNAYDYATNDEHREGITAFLEKRSAAF